MYEVVSQHCISLQSNPVSMKKRFEVLDVLRGVAVSMVVLFHMSAFSDTPLINNHLVGNSDLFIDFFFVISGFIISHNYRHISSLEKLQQFLKRRWLRMYPLHLTLLLVFGIIVTATHLYWGYVPIKGMNNANNTWMSFISSLLLLKSVKFPGVDGESWNTSSWIVSAVMISYIFFGGLMLVLHEVRKSQYKKHFAASIVVLAIAILTLVKGNGMLNYSYDFGYLRGLAGFFTGVLCHLTFKSMQKRLNAMPARFFTIAEIGSLLSIVIFIYEGDFFKQVGSVYLVLFYLAILVFAYENGAVSALLRQSGILKRIGQYAYSVYMTHTLLLSLFSLLFIDLLHLSPSDYTWLFAFNLLLIYEVSKWTYKHIEMRFAYKEKNISPIQTAPKKVAYVKGMPTAHNSAVDPTSLQ